MRILFDRYANGNLKVILELQGVREIVISKSLDIMPANVAYIEKQYVDLVLERAKGSKIFKTKNPYSTAIKFAGGVAA